MSTISWPQPSLIGGVSQQPDALRLSSQGRIADNAWMTPIDGLTKRWATRHVAHVLPTPGYRGHFSLRARDHEEQYAIFASHRSLRVFDLEGTEYSIFAPGGGTADLSYLDLNAPTGNLVLDPEDFALATGLGFPTWQASANALTPALTAFLSPYSASAVVRLKNGAADLAGTYHQDGTGSFAAIGVYQVFYVHFKLTGSFDPASVAIEFYSIADAGARWGTVWDTATDTVTTHGTGTLGGIDVLPEGWVRVWTAVASGGGTGPTAGGTRRVQTTVAYQDGSGNYANKQVLAWGASCLVNASAPADYVPEDAGTKLSTLTVADYSFILNSEKTVAMNAAVTAPTTGKTNAEYGEALLFVKNAVNCCHYYVRITTTLGSHDIDVWTRGTKPQDSTGSAGSVSQCGDTIPAQSNITRSIRSAIVAASGNITVENVAYSGAAGGAAYDGGAVLWLTGNITEGITKIEAWTDKGDGNIIAIQDRVDALTDLPAMGVHGFRVAVTGSQESGDDDYYVEFVGADDSDNDLQKGYWKEAAAPGITYQLDSSTMPHQLIRLQDDAAGTITGTPYALYFTFGPATWDERIVGDEDTNPEPSFVGRKIADIFFHANRLGFVADQHAALSENGLYFNFWRSTITGGVIDSDRIDIAASQKQVVIFRAAATWDDRLVLFSDHGQFLLNGEPTLTPLTASIDPILSFDVSRRARPQSVSRGVLFPFKVGGYSGLRELSQLGEELYDAAEVSAQAPRYIPGEVVEMAATSAANAAFLLADGERSSLFVYQWYWNGNQKLQSAWSRWMLGDGAEIMGVGIIEDQLYLAVQRADGMYFESATVGVDVTDAGLDWQVRLDRRFDDSQATAVYSGVSSTTTITSPYSLADVDTDDLVCVRRSTGVLVPIIDVTGDDIEVSDDVTDDFIVGVAYEFVYEFGPPKITESQEGAQVVLNGGRLQLRTGEIELAKTGSFLVEVTPRRKPTVSAVFEPSTLLATPDEIVLEDGPWRFGVHAEARWVSIVLRSSSHLPCRFQNVEWEATYSSRSTRASG